MKSIASRSNDLFKRLHGLVHSARERRKAGQTVLDGIHLVSAAREAGVHLQEVVVSDRGLADDEIRGLLAAAPDLDVVHLSDRLFAQLSLVESPTGLLAVADVPGAPAHAPFSGSLLILDGVQDPGNVGTMIRSGAAAGVPDVLLGPGCAQAWSPRALRAGMGGQFVMRVHEHADVATLLDGYPGQILAAALCDGARPLYDYDLNGPVAWLFGGEGNGLSEEMIAIATGIVLIPMPGSVDSLNVAAAAAVCLFEQVRQRRHASTRSQSTTVPAGRAGITGNRSAV